MEVHIQRGGLRDLTSKPQKSS